LAHEKLSFPDPDLIDGLFGFSLEISGLPIYGSGGFAPLPSCA
jgi:hypothetical protein